MDFKELCRLRKPFLRKLKQGENTYLQVAVKDLSGKLMIYQHYGNVKEQANWDEALKDLYRLLDIYYRDMSLEYVES